MEVGGQVEAHGQRDKVETLGAVSEAELWQVEAEHSCMLSFALITC